MPQTVKRIISGARVNFDPRTTAEAHTSRNMKMNLIAEERAWRRSRWEARKQAAEKKEAT